MPPLPISRSAMDALGKRLRAPRVDAQDWALLLTVLAEYQDALDSVKIRLEQLGLAPTIRVKSTGTLIDKLNRGSSLKSVQDLAGARVVVSGGWAEQDRVVGLVKNEFAGSRVIDRRSNPSHGYRAVHVIVAQADVPVEVQVRTELQHVWAEAIERLGDAWGRELRYGEPIRNGELEIRPGLTRDGLLALLDLVSELIHRVETIEGDLATTHHGPNLRDDEEHRRVVTTLSSVKHDVSRVLKDIIVSVE